jgi:hypothetical protein
LPPGALARPIDGFDLILHGSPFVLLAAKLWGIARALTGHASTR